MPQLVNKIKLTAGDLQVIGQLLVDVLGNAVSGETRQAIMEPGDAREIPPPYRPLLFSLSKTAIGLYLGHSAVASTFGAEFTQVYANK